MTSAPQPRRFHADEVEMPDEDIFFDIEPLVTAALYSIKNYTDREGAVEWCRPAAKIVVKAVLKALEEDGR